MFQIFNEILTSDDFISWEKRTTFPLKYFVIDQIFLGGVGGAILQATLEIYYCETGRGNRSLK